MLNDFKILGMSDLISDKIHRNNESLGIPRRKFKDFCHVLR